MINLVFAFVVVFSVISIYAACRLIDHLFKKEEMADQTAHDTCMINTVMDDINWLTDEMLKKTNDFIQNDYLKNCEDSH